MIAESKAERKKQGENNDKALRVPQVPFITQSWPIQVYTK